MYSAKNDFYSYGSASDDDLVILDNPPVDDLIKTKVISKLQNLSNRQKSVTKVNTADSLSDKDYFGTDEELPDLNELPNHINPPSLINDYDGIKLNNQKLSDEQFSKQSNRLVNDSCNGKATLKEQKAAEKAKAKQIREDEKERKKQEREEKARLKRLEQATRKTLQEAKRNAKPGNCMKTLTVMLDPGLLQFSLGAQLLKRLQEDGNLKFEVQQQPRANIITFWREVTQVDELGETVSAEEVSDQVLHWLPLDQFVSLIQAQKTASTRTTLSSYITEMRSALEERHVTVLVQGLDQYLGGGKSNAKRKKTETPLISRLDVEEVLVDVQLRLSSNIVLCDSDDSAVRTVLRYSKAVAEEPYKRDRLITGFTIHMDGTGSAAISTDGGGIQTIWRQQIQQFKNVSSEVANAIVAAYPCPRTLYDAYSLCSTPEEAERLLEDLVVRRGAGVMETSRRVGREMSRRLCLLFTSKDPDVVLN